MTQQAIHNRDPILLPVPIAELRLFVPSLNPLHPEEESAVCRATYYPMVGRWRELLRR